MGTDDLTYHGAHLMNAKVKSLCSTPETNIIFMLTIIQFFKNHT